MATVAVGDRKDRILAVGGMGPGTAAPGFIQAAADIQAFDPRENLWTRVGELPTPRTAARCLEHGGELWLFGGMDFRPEADDPDGAGMPLEILRAPIHGGTPNFRASGAGLPGPRRSFGAVVWKDRAVLLGGIHDGFQTLRQADTFEFATKEWRSLPVPPRAWVAAEMGVIGERFYVACGGTMTGRRFHEDRSLVSYSEDAGWQTLIADLGFSTRSVQMRVLRDRLWFVDTRAPGAVTIRVVRPRDVAVTAQVQPFH